MSRTSRGVKPARWAAFLAPTAAVTPLLAISETIPDQSSPSPVASRCRSGAELLMMMLFSLQDSLEGLWLQPLPLVSCNHCRSSRQPLPLVSGFWAAVLFSSIGRSALRDPASIDSLMFGQHKRRSQMLPFQRPLCISESRPIDAAILQAFLTVLSLMWHLSAIVATVAKQPRPPRPIRSKSSIVCSTRSIVHLFTPAFSFPDFVSSD